MKRSRLIVMTRRTYYLTQALVAIFLASCASAPPRAPTENTAVTGDITVQDEQQELAGAAQTHPDTSSDEVSEPANGATENITLGSGVFVQAIGTSKSNGYASGEGVTLNFEQADLKEFLRVVFETILRENYLIDPQVKGTVTVHTTRPVEKDAVLPIVETVLQQNDAALVRDEGILKIIPLADAEGEAGSPSVGRYPTSRARGYGVQVVPLMHVAAAEIEKILIPFVPAGAAMRVDAARNVLILSGPRYRLDEFLATVRTFDVDWLKGMSFAMFKLQYADAATLIGELESIMNDQGSSPLAGIVRLMPIERLNAVLAITHRPDHIADVQKLIEQFDSGLEGTSGRRLYVYELENGKAENIASVLQEIYGQQPDDIGSTGAFSSTDSAAGVFRSAAAVSRPPPAPGTQGIAGSYVQASAQARPPAGDSGAAAGGILAESQGDVTIIADQDNNSILVMASQQDYRSIEAAIRRLDIAPRQVLIEATIAEVSLSNTLTYGVRWFLQKSDYEIGYNAPVPSRAAGEGLAFAFFDETSDLKAFFDILATESSVKFLSTPQVMVLDNQTANIRVGDQIPVTTRSSQSTTNPDAPIVTEVQFRDTGTLLTVTPRISSGGQITLDISQEVSLPGTEPALGGGGNVSIAQRTINSSVIVQSGQTVVLGGLILENTNEGKSGIPVLMNIPLFGKLFSTTSEDEFRTELIVTVSPRVIENQRAMQQVTAELRSRMKKATEFENSVREADTRP
jgi:general secretion pathway protein D